MHPGDFYALPQSPQQWKQLLMVAGVERYFQIARCYRDEDLRADRQPEFTQLDLEMSFVHEDDILALMEELYAGLAAEVAPHLDTPSPFVRMTYAESMERYGSDKPDLRFGIEISDLTDIVRESEFMVFRRAIEAGGRVRGFAVPGGADTPRRGADASRRWRRRAARAASSGSSTRRTARYARPSRASSRRRRSPCWPRRVARRTATCC